MHRVILFLSAVRHIDSQSCVQSITGVMLCCAPDDNVCISKQREAHPSQDAYREEPDYNAFASPAPWYAGTLGTFARIAPWDGGTEYDLCVIGVPYDLGGSNSRLAPQMIRSASKRIQPYSRLFKQSLQQGLVGARNLLVVDADDLSVSPFDVRIAAKEIEEGVGRVLGRGQGCVVLGGDHGITYSLLKAFRARYGNFSLVHFDANLDAHGTPLKWSVAQGLFEVRHSLHVGIRGPVTSPLEDAKDGELGFSTISARDMIKMGPEVTAEKILKRLQRRDGSYMNSVIIIDMDVIDPAFAPGVENPEISGISVNDLQVILSSLAGTSPVLSAAVVGATPDNDPTKITALAAAGISNDLLHLMAKGSNAITFPPLPEP